jgi:hypothetical protein
LQVAIDRCRDDLDLASAARLENLGLGAAIGLFVLLKIHGLGWSNTDEGIYFYAAKRWAEGVWPYHDFFFSHPPLHIAVPAMAFRVFGYSFLLAKLIPLTAALIAGLAVGQVTRRFLGPLAGLLALTLFLFGSEVLKASTNLTGINLTTMWSCLGLWATLAGRPFLGGALLGAAAATGFYAVGYAAALAVLCLFTPPDPRLGPSPGLGSRIANHAVLRLILGFALIWGVINGLCYLVAGERYLDGVYRYHFLKRAKTEGYVPLQEGLHAIPANVMAMLKSKEFIREIYYHAAHWWLALLAPAALAALIWRRRLGFAMARNALTARLAARGRRHRPEKGAALPDRARWQLLAHPGLWWKHMDQGGFVMLVLLTLLAMVVEFAQFRERYSFYFTLLMPLVAILAAASLTGVLRLGCSAIGCGLYWHRPDDLPARVDSAASERHAPRAMKVAVVVALALVFLWVPINQWANARAFPSESQAAGSSKGLGERLDFLWTPAPGPEFLSGLSRPLLWKDYRIRGNVEWGLHHYLWSKKRTFSTAGEMATWIRDHSGPYDTITGASDLAPLVALLSGRRLAADHVDTNSKVFKSGVIAEEEFWRRVCHDRLRYIVAGPESWFTPADMRRRPTIARHFHLARTFIDTQLKHWDDVHLELWERNKQDPEGEVCRYEGPRRSGEPGQ